MTDKDEINFAIRYLKKGLKSKRTPPLYEVLMNELGFVRELKSEACCRKCTMPNEWHYVKDGDLPKETNEFYVYSKEWGVEIRKFFADVGYFECRKNIIVAWKEIVLPKEIKENE